MKLDEVKEYCTSMRGKQFTLGMLVEYTQLPETYCTMTLNRMVKNNEVEKIYSDNKYNEIQYKLINFNLSYRNLATDFLNNKGVGYIFSQKGLCNLIKCPPTRLKYFVFAHVAKGVFSVIKTQVPFLYKVEKEVPKSTTKIVSYTIKTLNTNINKDNLYIFAFNGNKEIINENSFVSTKVTNYGE